MPNNDDNDVDGASSERDPSPPLTALPDDEPGQEPLNAGAATETGPESDARAATPERVLPFATALPQTPAVTAAAAAHRSQQGNQLKSTPYVHMSTASGAAVADNNK